MLNALIRCAFGVGFTWAVFSACGWTFWFAGSAMGSACYELGRYQGRGWRW